MNIANNWQSIIKNKRPPPYRLILVQFAKSKQFPPVICVGWFKKDYFVTPGQDIKNIGPLESWCDCLGDGFIYGFMVNKEKTA